MTGAFCAAPRHVHGEPEPAEPSSYLCRGCRTGLRRDLHALPSLHGLLEDFRPPPGSNGSETGVDPADHCRHIRGLLISWARLVCEERELDVLTIGPDPRWTEHPVTVLAEWLASQCGAGRSGWIAYQEWAGEMAGEIGEARTRAYAILNPWSRRSRRRADCPHCGSRWLDVTEALNGRRWSFVACPACGEVWELWEWWGRLRPAVQARHEVSCASH